MPKLNIDNEKVNEETELAQRFEGDVERLRKLHKTLRNLEGPSDFVPFESGKLNSAYNNWLAIGLELSSSSVAQGYVIEKMVKLMRDLETLRRENDLNIRPDKPWPFVDPDKSFAALNEDAKKAFGVQN